jgi:hypothetical protein
MELGLPGLQYKQVSISGLEMEAGNFSLTLPGWGVAAKFSEDAALIKFILGLKK